MFFTDDPVRDWNRHCEEQENAPHMLCDNPKCPEPKIYIGDSYYEDCDGMNLCEECAKDWMESKRVRYMGDD